MKLRINACLSILTLLILGLGIYPSEVAAQTAKVYIFRKQTIGTITKPEISVNDIMVGQLPNKKYIECVVPVGNVTVSMYLAQSGNNNSKIDLYAEEGKVYYVKSSVNIIGGTSLSPIYGVQLTRTNDTDGEKQLKKCKETAVADISDYGAPSGPAYAQQSPAPAPQPQPQTQPQPAPESKKKSRTSDVDKNIPITNTDNKNTFVLIIANEDYTFVDNVQFALNDGNTFKEYCAKTLGIPERQIWLYENASLGIISSGVNKMVQAMNIFNDANAIIYYCGHGIPDEKTGDAYIIPVDGKGTDVSSCYSLNRLYKTMAEANASNVTYFMDACFTGANRDGSMLVAARGVAREPKKEVLEGNTIVFSAASGDETAMPFIEKGHGLFTYFLLKKLQETKGNVTYGELADYINDNVKREAFLTNEKPQNPVVATSGSFSTTWKNVKIK